MDKKSKEIVAVKKIFDAFRNQTDAQRTFREIMFLQAFRDHPNVIRLRGLHKASNNKDIYLVFDYMDTDLHHVIKKGNILKDVHRRYIMYQLLRATRYLHSGDVIHRDQKPSNILINAECKIKLADFGLARSVANYYAQEQEQQDNEGPPLLTDYVATRWYRAPEILVASKRYINTFFIVLRSSRVFCTRSTEPVHSFVLVILKSRFPGREDLYSRFNVPL